MYEPKGKPPLPSLAFRRRIFGHSVFAAGVIVVALAIGVIGYHFLASLAWIDSLVEASMILGGMGPLHELPTDAAKLFASFYALFSGLAFIGIASIMLAPFVHRLMHRFHWEEGSDS